MNAIEVEPEDIEKLDDLPTKTMMAKLHRMRTIHKVKKTLGETYETDRKTVGNHQTQFNRNGKPIHRFNIKAGRYTMHATPNHRNVSFLIQNIVESGATTGTVKGTRDFRQMAWLYGKLHGLELTGYEPSKADRGLLGLLNENQLAVDSQALAKSEPESESKKEETPDKEHEDQHEEKNEASKKASKGEANDSPEQSQDASENGVVQKITNALNSLGRNPKLQRLAQKHLGKGELKELRAAIDEMGTMKQDEKDSLNTLRHHLKETPELAKQTITAFKSSQSKQVIEGAPPKRKQIPKLKPMSDRSRAKNIQQFMGNLRDDPDLLLRIKTQAKDGISVEYLQGISEKGNLTRTQKKAVDHLVAHLSEKPELTTKTIKYYSDTKKQKKRGPSK